MPLTDEQINACLSHDGDRTAMLNAAYRMGLLRAAEIALEDGKNRKECWPAEWHMSRRIAGSIRAEAGD